MAGPTPREFRFPLEKSESDAFCIAVQDTLAAAWGEAWSVLGGEPLDDDDPRLEPFTEVMIGSVVEVVALFNQLLASRAVTPDNRPMPGQYL